MSELLNKMNQQFTDMQKLATDFAAMAEQAIIERDKARERVARLEGALKVLADIPLEDFGKENMPYQPLMGWNGHQLFVHHVLEARNALEGK